MAICIISIAHHEHLVTTGMTVGKRSREKQGEKDEDGFTNRLKEGQVTAKKKDRYRLRKSEDLSKRENFFFN